MKKKLLGLISLCLCAFLLCSCSVIKDKVEEKLDFGVGSVLPVKLSDNYKTESWQPAENGGVKTVVFENISFYDGDGVSIKVVRSDEERVEATFSKDLEDHGFEVAFSENEIKISTESHKNFETKKFELAVYADFDEIVIAGGIPLSVNAAGASSLSLDVSGAAKADIFGADAENISIDIKGAADIEISGKAENFSLFVAGAGNFDGKKLLCKNADISIAGAGNAEISVTDNLKTSLSGVGSVEYYGSPSASNSAGGIGSVEQKSEKPYVS